MKKLLIVFAHLDDVSMEMLAEMHEDAETDLFEGIRSNNLAKAALKGRKPSQGYFYCYRRQHE